MSLLVAATALAESYKVDTTHSEIVFKVSHLGISTVTGHFNDFDASFELDPSDLSTLRVQATIQTKSVDTIGTPTSRAPTSSTSRTIPRCGSRAAGPRSSARTK